VAGSVKRVERTCCVCRSRTEKRDLIRLVCTEGRLELDEGRGSKGRGAYVHADTQCLARAAQPARWERALKVPAGTLGGQQVSRVFAELIARVTSADISGAGEGAHQSGKGSGTREGRRVRL
jgi:predicted RNA-binding protein YlxR (DUF448 family)